MPIVEELLKNIRNNNPELTILDIRERLTPEDVTSLAAALKVNKTIGELTLRNCGLGDKGAKVIAEVLKVNKSIIYLNLIYNKIGNKGAKALAEALEVNKTIANLNLMYNEVDIEGVKVIAKALKINKSIINLYLSPDMYKTDIYSTLGNYETRNKKIISKVTEGFIDMSPVEVCFADQDKTLLSFKKLNFIKLYSKCNKGALEDRLHNKFTNKVIDKLVSLKKRDISENNVVNFYKLSLAKQQSSFIKHAIKTLDQDIAIHFLFYAMVTKHGIADSLLGKLPTELLQLSFSFLGSDDLCLIKDQGDFYPSDTESLPVSVAGNVSEVHASSIIL